MKIALLLSGGVDSSVALNLLCIEGTPRRSPPSISKSGWKTNLPSWANARGRKTSSTRAPSANRPVYRFASSRYRPNTWTGWSRRAVSELRAGRTPSPDIVCNRQIKFGEFAARIDGSFHKLASGHYAQNRRSQWYLLPEASAGPRQGPDLLSFRTQPGRSSNARVSRSGTLPNSRSGNTQGISICRTGTAKTARASVFWARSATPTFVRAHLGEWPGDIVERGNRRPARPPPRLLVLHHRTARRAGPCRRTLVRGPERHPATTSIYMSPHRKYRAESGVEPLHGFDVRTGSQGIPDLSRPSCQNPARPPSRPVPHRVRRQGPD